VSSIDKTVPLKCFNDSVPVAGVSVRVSSGLAVGGYILNIGTGALFVDPTGPASTVETETTSIIYPGQLYTLPPLVTNGVWVNSLTSGHRFIAVQIIPLNSLEFHPVPGWFPPSSATAQPGGSIANSIPSYLYQEYSDDDDLQAFVSAYNSMQQNITDTFNGLNLPIYTKDPISGALLDWVGAGIYGMPRPSLSTGAVTQLGEYNTLQYNQNQFVYNDWQRVYPPEETNISDDLYRRILTWHYSKAPGKYFSIQWLKKRVMQFLIGTNGANINIDNTYRVSVSFGAGNEVTIRIINGDRTIHCNSMYNDNCFQYNAMGYNELDSTFVSYTPFPIAQEFKNAVLSGVLELPFQFKFDVAIG
jgi:hypothetical protein